MKPLLTNERGQREWLWLQKRVPESALKKAFEQLGNKKPYPLNLARLLGLELPRESELPLLAEQKQKAESAREKALAEAKRLLKGK